MNKDGELLMLSKQIIYNSGNVDNKIKEKFWNLSNNPYIGNNFQEQAKILISDFEYCKKTKSDECYLNFIKGKKGLEGYENITKKYNDFLKKYGKDIKKEIILKGLKNDIKDDVFKTLDKSKKEVSKVFKSKYNLNINNTKNSIESFFDNGNILIKSRNYNYFGKGKIKSILEKKYIIDNKIGDFKRIFGFNFKDIIYKENKKYGSYNKVLDVIININDHNFTLSYNDFNNNLYIIGNIDVEEYLLDTDYKNNYFRDFIFINLYFTNDIFEKQTLNENLKEENNKNINDIENFTIKNNYTFKELLNNKKLIDHIALKYNHIGDYEKLYFKKIVLEYFKEKGFIFSDNIIINNIFTGKNGYYIIPKKYILKFPKNSPEDYIWFTYKQEGIGNLNITK